MGPINLGQFSPLLGKHQKQVPIFVANGKVADIYNSLPLAIAGGQKESGRKKRPTNNNFLSKEPGQPESKVQDKHTNRLDQPK